MHRQLSIEYARLSKTGVSPTAQHRVGTVVIAVMLRLPCGPGAAAPLALLDRNGSYVSIEAYAPNIVRVTLSVDKDLALGAPGFGFVGATDGAGWKHQTAASGDSFSSDAMTLEVAAQPWPRAPSQMERSFAPSLPPASPSFRTPGGKPILGISGWEMAPHTVNGEKTFRVGASFHAPADEHYYGLGQKQEGVLDYRGRSIDCKHFYDAPAGETVCVPFMVTNKGYGIVWRNPSDP